MEETDEAIANEHEEAKRSAGAHDDEGDQPLRQALISKPSLQSQERSTLNLGTAHAHGKECHMHGVEAPKDGIGNGLHVVRTVQPPWAAVTAAP